jgi:hypothetical protein
VRTFRTYATARTYPFSTPKHPAIRPNNQVSELRGIKIADGVQTQESDLGRISDLPTGDGHAFIAELDRIVAANFTNDYWEISLPNRLDTSAPRSPALSAYLAVNGHLKVPVGGQENCP